MKAILEGKNTLITGSSSGIGKALAEGFASLGANIIITGRDTDRLRETEDIVNQTGQRVLVVPGDVQDYSDVKNIVDKGIAEFGKIDILINNAGFSRLKPITRFRVEEFQDILKTNILGPFNFTHAVVPYMIESGGGTILNTGTVAVKVPMPKWSAYAMSKGALNTFTEFVATELKPHKITINTIMLNMVDTPLFRLGLDEEKIRALNPMDPKLLTPYFAFFATPAAEKYTGFNIDMDVIKKVLSLKDKLPEEQKSDVNWSSIQIFAEESLSSKQYRDIRKLKKYISFLLKIH
ncbi:MAG: SDR family oxidoreductase [Candidatus Lokiarchaeota archaeon]|nr:SDR family oxidoreductase [Candidatus Lokiarchaeota archaeon]